MASTPVLSSSAARAMARGNIADSVVTRRGRVVLHVSEPESGTPQRVVIVLHGRGRNADAYCRQWRRAIGSRPVAAVAPHFDAERFPGWRGYNLGGMLDRGGRPTPPDSWLFGVLEEIEAHARTRFGDVPVDFFGHSAGAQLVFRHALFSSGNLQRTQFIAANAGWYTLPSERTMFPYGLGNAPAQPDLRTVFARRLTLMAGALDNDAGHHSLRHDVGADMQGATRLNRANYCMDVAIRRSAATPARLNWQLDVVEGTGHSNSDIAPHALKLLEG